jgi:hypothetical protein
MSNWARQHLRHEVLVGGISNMVFNGIIAWLLLKGGPNQAWQGSHSFVVDILATAFILPFIVALIVIPLQKSKLNKGKLQTMDLGPNSRLQSLVNRLPQSTFLNALLFGACGMTVIAPLTIALLALSGVAEFTPLAYSIFKGVWAGLMAGILVIPMVMSALRRSNLNSALETAQ